MGNGMSPCLRLPAMAMATATDPAAARLVYWGGSTRLLLVADHDDDDGSCSTAGDVAAGGEHVVCPADGFFVGLPIPIMSPAERLLPGWTYFVLPAARFASLKVLTAATLSSLSPEKKKVLPLAGPGQCPFEYVKGDDGGAALIRVLPEFIEKVITTTSSSDDDDSSNGQQRLRGASSTSTTTELLCSTPELKRHYAQLVGTRSQQWSPRLETITECSKNRILRSVAAILSSR